ncbi:MAG: TlyA family RNA methyltransferase [Ktedonobacterales bacterium]
MSGKPERAEGPAQASEPVRRRGRASRERLDVLLVEQGLAPSRERARALIMAREVRVDGRFVDKAGTLVPRDATCEIVGPAAELRFVSRGGLKLERALDAFGLDPSGRVCLDIGASTGGFTDVLLRRGATRVYAIDVGRGQLAWTLRTDPRVVVMDRTNIRHLTSLPETASCAVIDVSFISLRLVLPAVTALLAPDAWIVALVKPQFEAGRTEVDRGGGVISDPVVHRRILRDLLTFIETPALEQARDEKRDVGDRAPRDVWPGDLRLAARGLVASPITGRDGNHEYLLWLQVVERASSATRPAGATDSTIGEAEIEAALADAFREATPRTRDSKQQV